MTDLVERLRGPVMADFGLSGLGNEAADEIERLQHEVNQMEVVRQIHMREIERLRAANKLLQEELTVLWGPRDNGTVVRDRM